jgi:flagellar basal-body rod modification protein FlgD
LQILKTNGQLVKTINLGVNPKGLMAFQWDGYDERGDCVGPGSYNIKARMTTNGKQSEVETDVYGLVTSETKNPTGTRQKVTIAGMGDFDVTDIRAYKS